MWRVQKRERLRLLFIVETVVKHEQSDKINRAAWFPTDAKEMLRLPEMSSRCERRLPIFIETGWHDVVP